MTHNDRQIVFHLGFQKTGTTSIQAMLNANKNLLQDIDLRAYGDATKDLRVAGRGYCASPTDKNLQRLRRALKSHISGFLAGDKKHCLISDENILGRVPYGDTGDILTWAKRILPVIEQELNGISARFVFYTREQVGWLPSLYKQSVKRARVTATFDVWKARSPIELDCTGWRPELQSYSTIPVEFISMEQELKSGDTLGTALLVRLGVDPGILPSFVGADVLNTSLSARALQVMRLINRMPLSDRRVLRISELVETFDRGLGNS